MRYVHSKQASVYSPFMHIGWPRPQGEKVSWRLNTRTRTAGNVSNEKSKARCCTQSKKEVSGDLFVSSYIAALVNNESNKVQTLGAT